MSRTIAARNKIPFGTEGINVTAALLPDGTEIVNLKISKQCSSLTYDLIDPSTDIIYKKMKITTSDKNGIDLDMTKPDVVLLKEINKGEFFIRVESNGSSVGFVSKFQENLVQLNTIGQYYLDKDLQYIPFFNNGPQPHQARNGNTGMQTVFHKPDGSVYVGTGIPSTQLIVSTDGLIELALGIRYWKTTPGYPTLITPIQNVYTRVLESTGDWTIPFSIGMKVPDDIGFITDYYDVTLTYFGKNDGSESEDHKLVFTLTTVNGLYHLVPDNPSVGTITDSYNDPQKRFLQNSSRYKFYSGFFVDPPVATGQIPLGLYQLQLKAVHKETGLTTMSRVWANISR